MRYRRRRRRSPIRRVFVLLLFLGFATVLFAELRLPGIRAEVQQATLRAYAYEKISDCLNDGAFAELTPLSGREISVDASVLASLKSSVTEALERALRGKATARIPIGNLTGLSVLNGRGFLFPVTFQVESAVSVEFQSELQSAGINRTRYGVTMQITAELYTSSTSFSDVVTVTTSYPILESVTQGEVPNSYFSTQSDRIE